MWDLRYIYIAYITIYNCVHAVSISFIIFRVVIVLLKKLKNYETANKYIIYINTNIEHY